ncbi:unnamed protein product [Meganyctiphanes norvegica]|uniref:BRISC and BRCA1-A complex member 2 n=1 Tax=Meganyctiphanes norvegica TaxID=48144 RepID=A0AAV2Q6I3_MEGNR
MDNKIAEKYNEALKQISQQIDYIKVKGFPGLCGDLAEIQGNTENFTVWESSQENHRVESLNVTKSSEEIVFKLPFAGTMFTIKLLFHLHEPWMPPDMNFSDQHFFSYITPKILEEDVPSLNAWDYREEDIICQLLSQLLMVYKNYQLERIEEDDVLMFEYQSLIKNLQIGAGDIEVLICGQRASSMVVRLPLNLRDVPPVLVNNNPGLAVCILLITFHDNDGTFTPKLYMSRRVDNLIGGHRTLCLPSVPQGTCLSDYVERVMELLEERVRKSVQRFEIRKQFIAQVLCQFGCAVMEYDAERFYKIVLKFEWQDFHFLAFINLPVQFPTECPSVVLQSLYHLGTKEPVSQPIRDLKFNATWPSEAMVQKIRVAIIDNIASFQNMGKNNS